MRNKTKLPEYNVYQMMKQRCYNKNHGQYKNYGKRGITVCEKWLSGFDEFYKDMGPRPEGTSLDRINNDKGYSPSNCRWATPNQQQNNRRDCVSITHNGKTMTLTEWSRELGLLKNTIYSRYMRGVSIDKMLNSRKYPRLGRAKLTESQVREVKRMLQNGDRVCEIRRKTKIRQQLISNIKGGAWAWVAP